MRKFNAAYFTASCDPVEKNTRFAKSLKLDYPILSDPEKNVAKAYGVVNEKRAFPYRRCFYIGKDGKILHIENVKNAGGHGAAIAAQLKKLGVEAK